MSELSDLDKDGLKKICLYAVYQMIAGIIYFVFFYNEEMGGPSWLLKTGVFYVFHVCIILVVHYSILCLQQCEHAGVKGIAGLLITIEILVVGVLIAFVY